MPVHTSLECDFKPLEPTLHMLQWLAEDPLREIVEAVSSILDEQVSGSILRRFRVVTEPEWLTGALRSEDDPNIAILVRCGVAFPFVLQVEHLDNRLFELQGVYSRVGVDLNLPDQARQRVWLDIDGDMPTFGSNGALHERLYFE